MTTKRYQAKSFNNDNHTSNSIFNIYHAFFRTNNLLNGWTPRLVGNGLPCPTQAFGGGGTGGQVTRLYGTHLICGTARWRAASGAQFFI
jgi:hypothetical protein